MRRRNVAIYAAAAPKNRKDAKNALSEYLSGSSNNNAVLKLFDRPLVLWLLLVAHSLVEILSIK